MKPALCNLVLWTSLYIFGEKRRHPHSPPGLARQSGCALDTCVCFAFFWLLKAQSAPGLSLLEQVCVFMDHFSSLGVLSEPLCPFPSPFQPGVFPHSSDGGTSSVRSCPHLLSFGSPSALALALSSPFTAGKTGILTTPCNSHKGDGEGCK